MKDGNLILVGFMGSGKSAVGRELARLTGKEFIDLDRRIEAKRRMSISMIFRKMGEGRFRDIEHAEVRTLAGMSGKVVAVGGGAAVFPRNRPWLRRAGRVVYLRTPVAVLVRRLAGSKSRPLLRPAAGNRRALAALISSLLKKRSPAYASAAHLSIDAGRGNPRAVAARILARIGVSGRG
jgi:shikimate kinase